MIIFDTESKTVDPDLSSCRNIAVERGSSDIVLAHDGQGKEKVEGAMPKHSDIYKNAYVCSTHMPIHYSNFCFLLAFASKWLLYFFFLILLLIGVDPSRITY